MNLYPKPTSCIFASDLEARLPSVESAASLMQGLMTGRRDAADELLDVLVEYRAESLLKHATACDSSLAGWRELLDGGVQQPARDAARMAAKRLYAETKNPLDRAAGLLLYLVVVAAGYLAGDESPSTMPEETLQDWLSAVGEAIDGELGEMLRGASNRLVGDGPG